MRLPLLNAEQRCCKHGLSVFTRLDSALTMRWLGVKSGCSSDAISFQTVTMKSLKICFVALSVVAFASFPTLTKGQSKEGDRIIYPPEFSPLVASRPRPVQRSLVPSTKFVKVENAIPNRYIVVLNDDVVSSDAPLNVRREQVTAIANAHAQAHFGKVGFIYETALKGYSIELPNEAAAIAISQNPQVKWVEEDGSFQGWLQGGPEPVEPEPPQGEIEAFQGNHALGVRCYRRKPRQQDFQTPSRTRIAGL